MRDLARSKLARLGWTTRGGLWRLAFGLLLLASAGESAAAERFETALRPEPGDRLVIELASGTIDVSTHAAPEVRVEAIAQGLGAGDVAFELHRDAENARVLLSARDEDWLRWLALAPHVRLDVWMPHGMSLEIATASAAVRVTGSGGPVVVRAEDGSIRLREARGDVAVDARGGDVRVEDVRGHVRIRTGSGRVDAVRIAGPVEVESASGRVALFSVRGDVTARTGEGSLALDGVEGRLDARSTRGAIFARLLGIPHGSVASEAGDVDVSLPADAAPVLAVRSESGEVSVDETLGLAEVGEAASQEGGSGGLRVFSERGDVRVRAEASELAAR